MININVIRAERIGRQIAQVIPKEKVGEILPWVHIAISNAGMPQKPSTRCLCKL